MWVDSLGQLLSLELGGLAFPNDADVQKTAAHALTLFDANPNAPGALHAQSQRFLCKEWCGLHGRGDASDPPLRHIMETLASGSQTIADFLDDAAASSVSFLRWVPAFRHVTCLTYLATNTFSL